MIELTLAQIQYRHRVNGNKLCTHCNTVKLLSEFYPRKNHNNEHITNGYANECKKCAIAHVVARKQAKRQAINNKLRGNYEYSMR